MRSVWFLARRRGCRCTQVRGGPDNAARGRNGRAGFSDDGSTPVRKRQCCQQRNGLRSGNDSNGVAGAGRGVYLARMLSALRVKNLAIVENVRVEFGPGLNIITGETGAGKSILVGALGLVLGERADKTMIRAGVDRCGVEAVFQLADATAVDAVLAELGIDPCEDGRLIVRRIVALSGTGKNLVNDCPTTLQVLKRIGDLLVDMHGPHDHQSLLSPEFQVDLLDSFGHLWERRAGYEALHGEQLELCRRLDELAGDDQEILGQIDLLAFQVKEIKEAGFSPGDEEDLERDLTVAANARKILEAADTARRALTEGEMSAFDCLVEARNAVSGLSGLLEDAAAWEEEAGSAVIQVQELSDTLNRAVQGIEADGERLQWLEDRMALLHRLKRKYGSSVEDMLTFLARAEERLAGLESRGERIAEVNAQLAGVRARRDKAAGGLGRERRREAKRLAAAVTEQIRDLGFAQGEFSVEVSTCEPGPHGADSVEFGFAPNVGEPMRPLRAIASSGEISRVMLATKAVLAAHDRIPVLVFDEIDANVGGEMGNAIGDKLDAVCENHQVLCITHLPQVAVHGASHLVVTKTVREGRTHTAISAVSGEDRAAEVARMLGGPDLTSVALRHAREMLERGGE